MIFCSGRLGTLAPALTMVPIVDLLFDLITAARLPIFRQSVKGVNIFSHDDINEGLHDILVERVLVIGCLIGQQPLKLVEL